MMGSWRAVVLSAVTLAFLAAAAPSAPTPDKTKPDDRKLALPAVLDKKAPENAKDLADLQEHVKKVLKKVTPAVVGIRIGMAAGSGPMAAGSGVIIDEEGHVLTAGHVSGKPGRKCYLIFPDGKEVEGKTLGQNVGIDSGLIKIVPKGKYPHVAMGDSENVKPGQWVLSLGHPGGFRKGRTPVVRLGRVSMANNRIIRSDCTLVGGDSGGPLFDMHGNVIGIHSRIGPPITENVHVPVNTYRDTWDRLVKGESWGPVWLGFSRRSDAYMGVRFPRGSDELKVVEVYKDSPADKAGLAAGDVILAIDGTKLKDRLDLIEFMQKKKVGDEIVVLVQRDDEEVKVKLKLGKRPPPAD
jgi:serine protease Do